MNNTECLITKLNVMKEYLEKTNDERCSDALNDVLEDLACEDTFGTEGQNDPRGDQRDAEFAEYDEMSPEEQEEWYGEFEYFDVGDVYTAPEVVQNLIDLVKREDDDEYSEGILDAFNEMFDRFGF